MMEPKRMNASQVDMIKILRGKDIMEHALSAEKERRDAQKRAPLRSWWSIAIGMDRRSQFLPIGKRTKENYPLGWSGPAS
jgi:hypothetical protein